MVANEAGQRRVVIIPPFQGAIGQDYPFWKVRVKHYLKQQGLLHCLDRIPPMEEYDEAPAGATEEEKALLNAKYQQRLKEDDEVANLWTSLDNDAMAMYWSVSTLRLDRLDSVYLRHGRLALFSIRRKLYNLRTAGYKTLMELFLAHERFIQELERAGEVVSASEKLNTLLVAIPDRHQSILDAIAVMRQGDLATMSLSDIRSLFLDAEEKKEKETRACYECGKVGHTKKYCYRLLNKEAAQRKRHGSERELVPAERANIALVSG